MNKILSVQASVATDQNKDPKPGCLEVQDQRLTWTPDGQGVVHVHVVHDIRDFFVNKKATVGKQKKPKMRIELIKKECKLIWTVDFKDYGDRDKVMERLKDIRSQHKVARQEPVVENGAFTPKVPLPERETSRTRVLSNDPELLALHTQFVKSGVMTEDEFWQAPERKKLLHNAEEVTVAQPTGMRSHYFTADLEPTRTSNHVTYTLNKQKMQDIFRELPKVHKAWMDNVPDKMSEQQFWEAFFKSHYFNREEKRKDDIFLEIAPAEQAVAAAFTDPSVDLKVSEETPQGYGLKDCEGPLQTPGAKKPVKSPSSVVIEQFNRHSTIVLASATAASSSASSSPSSSSSSPLPPNTTTTTTTTASSRPSSAAGELQTGDSMSVLVAKRTRMDDLEEPQGPRGIPLKVQDRSRYFESHSESTESVAEPVTNAAEETRAQLLQCLTLALAPPPKEGADAQPDAASAPPSGVPGQTPPPMRPLARLMFTPEFRETAANALQSFSYDTKHQPRGVGGADRGSQDPAVAEYEAQLNGHANKVIEVLRHFWSINLSHGASPEEQKKIDRLNSSMEDLRQDIVKMQNELPIQTQDVQKPPLDELHNCLSAALDKIRKDKWDTSGKRLGPELKRPAEAQPVPLKPLKLRRYSTM